jgi:hypoxanthine phosphoribosyltransferase
MEYVPFSFEEAEFALSSIARSIQESGFHPDTIVGISRGGLVPARLLSDLLDVRDVRILIVSFYDSPGKTLREPQIPYPLPGGIRGKNVLLVDDISDTGSSMKAAMEHLLSLSPKSIKGASIHLKETSSFTPDFFFAKSTKWIVYPWEKEEFKRDTGLNPEEKK